MIPWGPGIAGRRGSESGPFTHAGTATRTPTSPCTAGRTRCIAGGARSSPGRSVGQPSSCRCTCCGWKFHGSFVSHPLSPASRCRCCFPGWGSATAPPRPELSASTPRQYRSLTGIRAGPTLMRLCRRSGRPCVRAGSCGYGAGPGESSRQRERTRSRVAWRRQLSSGTSAQASPRTYLGRRRAE
jgi:hypothetical protein